MILHVAARTNSPRTRERDIGLEPGIGAMICQHARGGAASAKTATGAMMLRMTDIGDIGDTVLEKTKTDFHCSDGIVA